MNYKKDLVKEREVVAFFRDLTEVFGEIASIRMMKVRDSVLESRRYIEAITGIFYDSLSYYLRKRSGKARQQKITFLAHNGKTVSVLVSANTGLYGNVLYNSFARFSSDFNQDSSEATIIGRIGRSIFEGAYPGKPYTYFDLPDFGEEKQKLVDIINHLVQYDEVRIYYTKYATVLNQETTMSQLTAGTRLIMEAQKRVEEYIFEPSVEELLMFFEKEVFATFFDQSIKESQLSKLAGRITAMDEATQNARKRLREINSGLMAVKHDEANRKQLNTLSAVFFT